MSLPFIYIRQIMYKRLQNGTEGDECITGLFQRQLQTKLRFRHAVGRKNLIFAIVMHFIV